MLHYAQMGLNARKSPGMTEVFAVEDVAEKRLLRRKKEQSISCFPIHPQWNRGGMGRQLLGCLMTGPSAPRTIIQWARAFFEVDFLDCFLRRLAPFFAFEALSF